jgi:hypothetical protein
VLVTQIQELCLPRDIVGLHAQWLHDGVDFQPELVWHSKPDQFRNIALPPFASDGSWDVHTASDYGADSFGHTGLRKPRRECLLLGFLLMGVTCTFSLTLEVAGIPRSGRPRGAEDIYDNDGHQLHPRKKGMGKMAVTGVLEAAGTTSKARHKPAARTHTEINNRCKTAGCGAGRLAATTAQEVYHPSFPRPSAQHAMV